MESFAREILDVICEEYSDDKDLVAQILLYLYNTSRDDKMTSNICDIMSAMDYCLQCGDKMATFEWDELHTELEYDNVEKFSQTLCEVCDSSYIYSVKATKVE